MFLLKILLLPISRQLPTQLLPLLPLLPILTIVAHFQAIAHTIVTILTVVAHFQAIAHTMHSSYKELSLLLLFVGMGMLIFGRLVQYQMWQVLLFDIILINMHAHIW